MTTIRQLTPDQIETIRKRYLDGETTAQLAVALDIPRATIVRVVRGLAKEHPPSPADLDRFWSKVDRSGGEHACWNWTGGVTKQAGQFAMAGTTHQAHRLSYILSNGPIPRGFVVRQQCGNRLCINPAHMQLQSAHVRLPHRRGEAHGFAKLSDAQVAEIRMRYARGEVTMQALAREYGVGDRTIAKYIRGQRRTDAPGPITAAPLAQERKQLSADEIATLRARYVAGESQQQLATAFGIPRATVQRLVTGLTAQRAPALTPNERFWSFVDRLDNPDSCWVWKGPRSKGWGRFQIGRKSHQAQRMAYELTYGPIPPAHVVVQQCGNRLCVNPDHVVVEPVKVPHARGESHGHAKLSDLQVAEIRARYAAGGISFRELGEAYGVASTTISKYVRGQRRTDAEGPVLPPAPPPSQTWRAIFVEALRSGMSIAEASQHAGVTQTKAMELRRRNAEFARAWDDARTTARIAWRPRFLASLRQGARVYVAAAAAGVATNTVYVARRNDPEFAADWDDAVRTARSRTMATSAPPAPKPPVSYKQPTPFERELVPPEPPAPVLIQPPASFTATYPDHILVFGSDALVVQTIVAQLSGLGFASTGLMSGTQPTVSEVKQIDLILLDEDSLLNIDGSEIARLAAEYQAPILLLSINQAQMPTQMPFGIWGVIGLPIRRAALLPALQIAKARFFQLESLREEVARLEQLLERRSLLEHAKQILMRRHGISEAEAYMRLRQRARALRIGMDKIAQTILAAEELLSS